MPDRQQDMALVQKLVQPWEFQFGDEESAFGEVFGIPAAISILGFEPLSLMIAYKLAIPHPDKIPFPDELTRLVNAKAASVYLEGGYAWLSLYNLRGQTAEDIRHLFELFGQAIKQQGIALGPGCAVCGGDEGAELRYLEGKCSRICEPCVAKLLEQREHIEQELNRPSSLHAYALPWVVALAGAGWMLFWTVIDLLLDAFNTNVIVLDQFSMVMIIVVLAVVGILLGWPLGHVLRKSGSGRKFPLAVSIIALLAASLIGETLYVAISVYRLFGQFNLSWAIQLLIPFVRSYPPSWIICKIITAAAITFGCFHAATERETVGLTI